MYIFLRFFTCDYLVGWFICDNNVEVKPLIYFISNREHKYICLVFWLFIYCLEYELAHPTSIMIVCINNNNDDDDDDDDLKKKVKKKNFEQIIKGKI